VETWGSSPVVTIEKPPSPRCVTSAWCEDPGFNCIGMLAAAERQMRVGASESKRKAADRDASRNRAHRLRSKKG
jgi:hypothetical protein